MLHSSDTGYHIFLGYSNTEYLEKKNELCFGKAFKSFFGTHE